MWLGFQFLPENRFCLESRTGKGAEGTRVSWVGAAEIAGQEGVGVPKTVLAAFTNVFGTGPVLKTSQNYFRRQQI